DGTCAVLHEGAGGQARGGAAWLRRTDRHDPTHPWHGRAEPQSAHSRRAEILSGEGVSKIQRRDYRRVQGRAGARWRSGGWRALWATIKEKDAANLTKVAKILDTQGWVGPETIGRKANSALFLVVQHADHATQMKYLPMMREAVKNGKAAGSSLALLEDRVAL